MIKLLSTDFDGTLVSHDDDPPVVPELFEMLLALRAHGVRWAVNTGRTLDHIVDGLREFGFPLAPDFVLTNEREVFRPDETGRWVDYGDWNHRCALAHDELFAVAEPLIAEVWKFVKTETQGRAIDDASGMGVLASSNAEMDRIVAFCEQVRVRMPEFHYQRNTIYLRFCHVDYSKGTALAELARLLGIAHGEIFAAGDHHNDIAMLDGRFARWVACPGNSADEVKETVRAAGGYIARGTAGAGVVEALRFFDAEARGRGVEAEGKVLSAQFPVQEVQVPKLAPRGELKTEH